MSVRRELIAGAEGAPRRSGDELAEEVARPVDPEASEADSLLEVGIRPRRLADFVGQAELKERLAIVLEAASQRRQAVDHLLFAGPPGLGKTTLAGIVAAEMGAGFRVTSGPALVRTGDVAAILTDLQPGDVLFIDEIHRLGRAVEEVLYPAMEDFALDVMVGKGPSARSIRLDLPRFTLVGATTRTGLVTGPLRDRFGFVARLDHYGVGELEAIVLRSARLLGVDLTPAGAGEIAARSRGTPRLAIRLLRRVRDFVEVRGAGVVTLEAARLGLQAFGIDELGLDRLDRTILETLCERFPGRPVGLSTLAVSVGEETETVEDVYEPFLLKAGLLLRTPRGRLATPAAYEHLGLAVPPHAAALGPAGSGANAGVEGSLRPPRGSRRGAVPGGPRLFDSSGEPPRTESAPTSG
jgi:Holliday junction DNA helicase RuvB